MQSNNKIYCVQINRDPYTPNQVSPLLLICTEDVWCCMLKLSLIHFNIVEWPMLDRVWRQLSFHCSLSQTYLRTAKCGIVCTFCSGRRTHVKRRLLDKQRIGQRVRVGARWISLIRKVYPRVLLIMV